jgi:multidrug resistance efflux pump
MCGRLAAVPDQAEPLQRARLLAALSAGAELIVTWVRLAQRILVRVHIDEAPGVVSAAGMTAAVEIDDQTRTAAK